VLSWPIVARSLSMLDRKPCMAPPEGIQLLPLCSCKGSSRPCQSHVDVADNTSESVANTRTLKPLVNAPLANVPACFNRVPSSSVGGMEATAARSVASWDCDDVCGSGQPTATGTV
jgi:hypothetical protein